MGMTEKEAGEVIRSLLDSIRLVQMSSVHRSIHAVVRRARSYR